MVEQGDMVALPVQLDRVCKLGKHLGRGPLAPDLEFLRCFIVFTALSIPDKSSHPIVQLAAPQCALQRDFTNLLLQPGVPGQVFLSYDLAKTG